MRGMTDAQRIDFEAQKQKLEKLKIEAESLMKRLRGEEILSDKEVEGDLELVPSKFENEHGLRQERVDELVGLLLAVLREEPSDESPTGRPRPPPSRWAGERFLGHGRI